MLPSGGGELLQRTFPALPGTPLTDGVPTGQLMVMLVTSHAVQPVGTVLTMRLQMPFALVPPLLLAVARRLSLISTSPLAKGNDQVMLVTPFPQCWNVEPPDVRVNERAVTVCTTGPEAAANAREPRRS